MNFKLAFVVVSIYLRFATATVAQSDLDVAPGWVSRHDRHVDLGPDAPERWVDDSEPFFELDEAQPEIDYSPANTYVSSSRQSARTPAYSYRMRGEFERQSALMLAAGSMAMEAPDVLVELSRLAKGHVPLILLVNDGLELDNVVSILGVNDNDTTSSHRFAYVPHNTMWARDYGPIVLADRLSSPSIVVDSAYNDLGRVSDDAVPSTIAEMSNVATRHTTLCIPGGNLLSNGRGLCVTTTKVQEENAGTAQYEIADSIARSYGATTVAILEPLKDEPTGHVDMFATFTDANTVVVGRYSPSVDPINAEILDRNAERLASIRLGSERLRVVRIGMPPRADDQWQTFTNVVYANGLLLVPKYESSTEYQLQSVRKVYLRLLPDWQVQFVSADDLICNGGALHCVVSNLGTLQAPGTVEREVARPISSQFRVASWYSKTN